MSTKYKFNDHSKLYFVSFAVVYWIDVFLRRGYKDLFLESLKFCQQNKGLEIYGWCDMTNHVHLIIGCESKSLSDLMRDLKKYTSYSIIKNIENSTESRREWMLWMFERAGNKNANNTHYQFWHLKTK